MRLVTILSLMSVVVVGLCQPAIPGDVTVIQGGKRLNGWSTDQGRIFVENSHGKIIMDGWMNRMGAVEIYSTIRDDSYVGQVNPMGNGLLMSPKPSIPSG